jgi:hypothetical protein
MAMEPTLPTTRSSWTCDLANPAAGSLAGREKAVAPKRKGRGWK